LTFWRLSKLVWRSWTRMATHHRQWQHGSSTLSSVSSMCCDFLSHVQLTLQLTLYRTNGWFINVCISVRKYNFSLLCTYVNCCCCYCCCDEPVRWCLHRVDPFEGKHPEGMRNSTKLSQLFWSTSVLNASCELSVAVLLWVGAIVPEKDGHKQAHRHCRMH